MKEIGGFFELETFMNKEYYPNLLALNSARNALLYVMEAKKIKRLYIPRYLCDTVRIVLEKNGFEYEYYHVNHQLKPIFDKDLKIDEYLYVVNLFGQLNNTEIADIKLRFGNVIADYTHSFFQPPIEGIDTIYSCRKYFGVPDGAYLSTSAPLEKELESDASKERMEHLLGRFEESASAYYQEYIKNNVIFEDEPLKRMSRLTRNFLGAIDYEKVRQRRNENYNFLANKLGERNVLSLSIQDGAFAYPFYASTGAAVRKELAEKNIYIPTLWPNVIAETEEGSIENLYATNILPLPCDQRYTPEDLQYMVNELNSILNIKDLTSQK